MSNSDCREQQGPKQAMFEFFIFTKPTPVNEWIQASTSRRGREVLIKRGYRTSGALVRQVSGNSTRS